MSHQIRLRPSEPADEPFLFRVYAGTREEELSLTGWDDAVKATFLRMQSQAQSRFYLARFPDSRNQMGVTR
jgi:hypothetical protein